MLRRARWLIGSVLFAAAVTYALVGNPLDPFDNRRFSSQAWREGRGRTQMCRDIIRHVVRPGMTEKQVVELLGPPETVRNSDYAGDGTRWDGRIYEYCIDRWAFQSTDDAFLHVKLDPRDQVVTAEVYDY
ncbi:MAG: hypothetical protein QOG67_597 [Verrucomicrobiota bacterium]|jgi:hypothetical protein